MYSDKDWVKTGMQKYCVVANIVTTRVDENGIERSGTAAYPAGRKVFVSKIFSYNRDSIKVVGLNRFKKYVYEYVPLDVLTNIRPARTFSKTIISLMTDDVLDGICNEWFGYKEEDRFATELYARILNDAKNGDTELLDEFIEDFVEHRWEYFEAFLKPRKVEEYGDLKVSFIPKRCPMPDLLTHIGILKKERDKAQKKALRKEEALEKAKKIALEYNENFDRCNEYPNYFKFFESGNVVNQLCVSKRDGSATKTWKSSGDFFWDFLLREYNVKSEQECEAINYQYYPDINAVAKGDGCTFFDAERGFIFDIDGAWFDKGIFEGMRKSVIVSSEKAFEIVTRDDYKFFFFNEKMSRDDIDYYVKMGMPYRLKV